MRFSDRAKYWSESQDLNLRSPRPEQALRPSASESHRRLRMLPSVIGTIGSVPFGHHGPGRFASMPRRSIRISIPGSKSVPSRNWSRWDLVKNTLWDSMVRSRSHFATKYLSFFNNGSPPLGTNAPTETCLRSEAPPCQWPNGRMACASRFRRGNCLPALYTPEQIDGRSIDNVVASSRASLHDRCS